MHYKLIETHIGFNIDIYQNSKPNKVTYTKPERINGILIAKTK